MYILGISCFYHDAAAALLKDGVLVAAAEEERFSRKKHDFGYPAGAIQFCLEQAGITARDVEYVVFYEKPLVKFDRILMTSVATFPQSWRVFRESMITWFKEKLWIKKMIQTQLDLSPEKNPVRRSSRGARGKRLLLLAFRGGRPRHARRCG